MKLMIVLVIVAIAGKFILTGILSEASKHGPHRLIWRWFSGNTYHGKSVTNATWLRHATKVHTSSGTALRWHHIPRLHRAGYRTGVTLAVAGIGAGLLVSRSATIIASVVALAISIMVAGILLVKRLRKWYSHRVMVSPLAKALAPMLDIPESTAEKSIRLIDGYLRISKGRIGVIELPPKYPALPDQRAALEHVIDSRLPKDVSFTWHTSGNPMYVALSASPTPPTSVPFGRYVPDMESCDPSEVVLGLDRNGEIFKGSFALDDPHWAFSMGSGRGKSTILRSIAAQVLHNDPLATMTGIDPKGPSLTPLAGIPGVTLARDPSNIPEMWEAINKFYDEMRRRLSIRKDDPTAEFPMNLLVLDEINTASAMWAAYWRMIPTGDVYGERGETKPAKASSVPPAWQHIAYCAWQGREANCHIVVVGQDLTDKALGGFSLRSSFGLIGLAGYRKQLWLRIIGTMPVPVSQKPKGRVIFVIDGTESWVQCLNGSDQEFRDYALANRLTLQLQDIKSE